ncbi:MAG: FRG domain-containing protein [Bacteroidales bacterium]|nr:FRG domain-containing protein [Bacteroidales bacterium]
MAKLQIKRPNFLTEFMEIVEDIQSKTSNPLWYRGCSINNYELIPRLYRKKPKQKISDLVELEYKLMTRFRQRSIPFHDKTLENDWEYLFFMQHHGVPTRLLDWSENPFIAFYFAVITNHFNVADKKIKYTNPASIWILDPVVWNRSSLKEQSFDQGIISTCDEEINGYKPMQKFTGINELPIAVYGTHNSPNIVAQRGVFTIFGQNMQPMEKIYEKENYTKDYLIKITLNKSVLPKMRASIFNYGITESVVFPDLQGLAKEIRRIFGFEV